MAKTLQEVLEENNIQTQESANGRRVAHCPFHEGDRSPSFVLYPNETYYCFGCKVWGNPVKFLIDFKGMDTVAAIEYVGAAYALPKSQKQVIKIKDVFKTGKFLYDVAVQYHMNLMTYKGPIDYLTDRGITPKTIADHLIGYTDGSVLELNSAEEYALASEVGLLTKDGRETLSHRIVIPNIVDHTHADFMIGRTVINDKIKYLGLRMPKPLMGFHQYRHSPIIFMVEGQFDWLTLKQWGYPTMVMSGSNITRHNASLLRGRHIVYIPDNDEVGRNAAKNIVEKFGVFYTTIIDISEHTSYKDVSEWAQNYPYAEDVFREAAEEALWPILSLNPTYLKYVPQLSLLKPSVST